MTQKVVYHHGKATSSSVGYSKPSLLLILLVRIPLGRLEIRMVEVCKICRRAMSWVSITG